MTSLGLVRSGIAEMGVQTAHAHLEETIAALRPHEAPV
jgi:hypothetical protein